MFNKYFIGVIGALLLSLILSLPAAGQASDNGSLSGTVTDPNGAIVPGAKVSVKNIGTGLQRNVTASDEGRWTVSVLPLGDYEVKGESEGFQLASQTVTVVASTTTNVDLILGITVDANQVDIQASDRDALIGADNSATISSSVSGRALEAQPLVNRTPFGRLQQDTSSSGEIADPNTNGNGNPEISVHGTRTNSQGVQFNGIDATNASGTGSLTESISPAPETVQEVSFLSNLYDASLGRNGGGSIQLVTKGGQNKLFGTAYMYAQNETFNANDFFFNRDGIDRQKARRLEGGFTVGGPIIKDKTFFFGGYQKTDVITAYVPTGSSFVVLPEFLAFITNRADPVNFLAGLTRSTGRGIRSPNCVRTTPLPPNAFAGDVFNACIDPFSVGFRLFSLINPTTGDFLIPTLRPGYERLFLDPANNIITVGNVRITDSASIGLPDGFPLLDTAPPSSSVPQGGYPLVRQRNAFPAGFKQDQFTARFDHNIFQGNTGSNQINGTFFFANFPALEPFTDDTLVSPFPIIKDDKNRTLAITDTHVFNANLINETRFGYFSLDNTRRLDERLLTDELSNQQNGIFNPAALFAPGAPSQRLARFAGAGVLQDFSVGAPNDAFNKRQQLTLTFANNTTVTKGDHILKFGVEHKRNRFATNLPEEQGLEFEKIENFTELLISYIPEADVSLGITDKKFRFNDLSFYATDEWKFRENLTFNIGLRWDWFGRPVEESGRFANFDIARVTNPENILSGFVLPANSADTGFAAIDGSLPGLARSENNFTLNGQDLNNFAPRFGFAYKPFKNDKTIIRGGYGIFFDRPSAAFINTVYTNFPFFKEIERTFQNTPATLQAQTAFAGQNPTTPFINYFPYRVVGNDQPDSSPYTLVDGTPGSSAASGSEALEFRAVDPDLKTPMVQQWNLGIQQEFFKDWIVEARYVGTRGQNLLLAVGFNQPYDLNDPNTPDHIFGRLNTACLITLGCTLPPTMPGVSQRDRGRSRTTGTGPNDFNPGAFGACNVVFAGVAGYLPCVGGGIDLNLTPADFSQPRGIIAANLRVPYLGLDPTDSVILQSRGYSFYHSGQLNVSKRFTKGFSFTTSYTWSKSMDIGSTDPGSTAASGRPDTANLGLVVQGDQRNLNANRALSDFDRPHRFASSFVYEIPSFGSKSKFLTGWQLSGFGQWQSGTPFTIFASNAQFLRSTASSGFLDQFRGIQRLNVQRVFNNSGQLIEYGRVYFNVGSGSGTIYETAFGRPNVSSLALLMQQNCGDPTRCYFNTNQDPNNPDTALFAPLGGFGNLGRNTLRGPSQKRIDFSIQKTTKLTERISLELKWDIFNAFNFVNFANPNSDLSDETDFGQITRTVGAPRVMQFGAKLRF